MPTVNKGVCLYIHVCVNSHSGNLRVKKAREKSKSNLFFISIAAQCLDRIEYVKASMYVQVAFLSKEKPATSYHP